MIEFNFSVGEQGDALRVERVVLGDPVKTQSNPEVFACEVTMGAGPARAIFGSTPIGAVSNAVIVARAVIESRGEVTWR